LKSLFDNLGTVAGFVHAIVTFIVLFQLKGLFFTLVCLFVFPVFALFPIWAYFLWGYSNPILWTTTLTLIVGQLVMSVYKDDE
tara:strand:- start:449 stop:697 length:249 start_codon:yes stop_codon:yes gene_type:complete